MIEQSYEQNCRTKLYEQNYEQNCKYMFFSL